MVFFFVLAPDLQQTLTLLPLICDKKVVSLPLICNKCVCLDEISSVNWRLGGKTKSIRSRQFIRKSLRRLIFRSYIIKVDNAF